MVPDAYSTSFLLIAYRPDLHQLTGRWQYSVTEAELHQGYDALRRAALHYRCGNWLIDSRRCLYYCQSRLAWVTDRCLPQVQRELKAPLQVSLLVLPDYLSSLPAVASTPVPDAAVRLAMFLDEGEASSWLMAQAQPVLN
jgi:hypothetical protein